MRVLIVVLSLDREPWKSMELAQRQTWATPRDGVQVLYLQGKPRGPARAAFLLVRKVAEAMGKRHVVDTVVGRIASRRRVKLQGDIIRTKTFEYWVGTSAKMYACLQFLAERSDFDYLVRTNSSTYLHLPSMLEFLENAPRTRFYAGADQEQPHAQGTCIILSRDAVCSMSWDKSWDFHEVDDAAVGTAARRAGLTFVPVRQVVVESKAAASSFTQHNLRETFIFRMKTRGRRDEDIKALREVHRRLDDELGEN